MRLGRLRVSELRQFREPFELTDIQPGLNIFTGANEAGKSTLVRAIRAAFFERHRSTSVDDLRPYGDSAATPSVELTFEIQGTPYQLTKSFLQKKRCELMVGTRRLEGVEAEDFMAERLGFRFALKGASREEHWGIPGLLWIEQGAAHAVRDSVVNAADHLRSALDESLGEVAASGGDEVVTQVRKLRDELLTGTGKPRAAYQNSIDDVKALEDQVIELERSVTIYRDHVDQLRQIREAHTVDAREQPWVRFREEQGLSQQALQAVDALANEREAEREKLRQISGLRALLLQRLAAADQQQRSLATRESALASAIFRHGQAGALEQECVRADIVAAERRRVAREALMMARQEDNRRTLSQQLGDAKTRAAQVGALLDRASAAHERASTLQRDARLLRTDPGDLKALRSQQRRLTELEIRQAAVATRLRFELDAGTSVQLAGETVSGVCDRLLVAPATLAIPGIGQLHIAPGGSDLAELAQEHAQLQDEHRALLQRLGLSCLAEVEAREQSHAQKIAEATSAEKARNLLAPEGLDALHGDLDLAQARQAEASAALALLPAVPEVTVLPLATAEHEHEASSETTEAASHQLQDARQALATAASVRDSAIQERDSLQAVLADPQLQAQVSANRLELVEANAREAAANITIEGVETRIAAARPEILKQDVERLRRSADEAERLHGARDRQIVQLETALAAAGAQGLEEELAARQGESVQALRRREELQRRAEALDFLLARLELRRKALTRRLQAPLQRHLDRYLHLLFPSGQLEVDENLVPGALTRSGTRGPEAGDFDTLSFGAREQMGVISRLAYADLLKEAGRPTLLILDDALVHSDERRLAQMKRVLFDAAQRHQVLLFTCHPGNWRDIGVSLRALEDERSAAQRD